MTRARTVGFEASPVTVNDRLLVTLFLAGLFHLIVILGISFAPPDRDESVVPTLEVLLVADTLPETPVNRQASYLSQRTQQGSGDAAAEATRRPDAAGASEESPGGPEGSAGAFDQPRFIADASVPAATLPTLPRRLWAGEWSAVTGIEEDRELELKGAARRELLVTPSTRASDVAVYLDAWKRRVEQIGTLHFPNEARRRHLSGNPVIEVVLSSAGSLVEATVRRTSGHPELDRAAIEILSLASPFEAFPAELAARHDVLRFAYEWQFVAGRLAGSSLGLTP